MEEVQFFEVMHRVEKGIRFYMDYSIIGLPDLHAPVILQRSVWRCVAIQMLAHFMNESAWRSSLLSTELSASPWTPKDEILELFKLTPKPGGCLFEA